jgi:transposase-like protein
MELIPISCPRCESIKVIKRGKTEEGKQRYLCRNEVCEAKSFVLEYAYNGRKSDVKEKIIEMTLNGSGIRDIARVLRISTDTVIKEIKKKKFSSNR